MKRAVLCLFFLVLIGGGTASAAEGPAGYIIRINGKGRVRLLRGTQGKAAAGQTETPIPVVLKKRVFVYNGDRFLLAEGADAWYFAGNQVKQATHAPTVENHPDAEGPQWLRGYRPQDGTEPSLPHKAPPPPSFLFGSPKENNLYVPLHGSLGVVWFNPPGCTAHTLEVVQGSKRLCSEPIPPGAVKPKALVGLLLSKAVTEQLSTLAREPNGADVLLRLTFTQGGPGRKPGEIAQRFHIVPTDQCQQADYAEEQWRDATEDEQFVRLAACRRDFFSPD